MKEYAASTSIDASPQRVWEILTDAASYPEWDPYCEKIEGTIDSGKRIRAYSTLSPGRAFPVKVTEFVPNNRMAWTGGMPFGLFKGVRTFTLRGREDGGTDFTVREVFSGPMLKMIGKSLPDMTEPFRQFVLGLKDRAERG